MAYQCPRCGGNVQRGYSKKAQVAAGLVGALFYAAFGPLQCQHCGEIPRDEFPTTDRTKMASMTFLMVAGGVALSILGLWLVFSK
jgi:hypothetical protein